MSVRIHFCCLVPGQEQFVEDSLKELVDRLQVRYPQIAEVALAQLPASQIDLLVAYLKQDLTDYHGPDQVQFMERPVFVFCDANDEIATAMQQKSTEDDLEGAAIIGEYALAWTAENKYLVWHEALHLLYAPDCYDEERSPNCEEPRCIMQWEPNEENCRGDLYLCPTVYRWIINNIG